MKKTILILAALMLVVSGVAAVSAYEAHLINVKAHVENALTVDTANISFGTVFPEEWLYEHRSISLSDSAGTEIRAGNVDNITFEIYAEWKPVPSDANPYPVPVVVGSDSNDYYAWLGDCLYVGYNPDPVDALHMTLVGANQTSAPGAQPTGLVGVMNSTTPTLDLYVAIDVPVFEGYWNSLTDVCPKPSGLTTGPTWEITKDDYRYDPDGVDMGLDLKIQVTGINR